MRDGYVYFIASVGGPIKIGFSRDPRSRLKTLQVGAAERYALLKILPGRREDEARWHRRFAETRISGEWFKPTDSLLAAIEQIKPVAVRAPVAQPARASRSPSRDRSLVEVLKIWAAMERVR